MFSPMIPMPSPRGTNSAQLFIPAGKFPSLARNPQAAYDSVARLRARDEDRPPPSEETIEQIYTFLLDRGLAPEDVDQVLKMMGASGSPASAMDKRIAGDAALPSQRRSKPASTSAAGDFFSRFSQARRIGVAL